MITYYTYDAQGVFVGAVERTKYEALPKPCTTVAPPSLTGTQVARWDGSDWEVLAERPPLPAPPAPTLEEQKSARAEAYRNEADPLFFKTQRGEALMAEWSAKIEEIRTRYPYPIVEVI